MQPRPTKTSDPQSGSNARAPAACRAGAPATKGTRLTQLVGHMFLAAALWLPASHAHADGAFVQADYAAGSGTFTASLQRGRTTMALGWSEYAGGHATSLWLNQGFQVDGPIWFRLGPSLRIDQTGDSRWGIRAVMDRFSMTETHSLFLMLDVNTIQREYLLLGQVGHLASGWAAELSFQGNDQGYREETLAVSYRLGESPWRLRAGYRFGAQQAFVGVSLNTF